MESNSTSIKLRTLSRFCAGGALSVMFLSSCAFSAGSFSRAGSSSTSRQASLVEKIQQAKGSWNREGQITIARKVPSSAREGIERADSIFDRLEEPRADAPVPELLGFMPAGSTHASADRTSSHTVRGTAPDRRQTLDQQGLIVDRAEGSVTLGTEFAKAEGADSLEPGSYKVVHKQQNPLWYAPDSYYMNRGLPVPGETDKIRFRRGALGSYALFLDKDTPIHSGPVWSADVGGIRIGEERLAAMYAKLPVGATIVVK